MKRRELKETKLSLKLASRIEKLTRFTVIPIIRRTYTGRYQTAEGVWSWYMITDEVVHPFRIPLWVGSHSQATKCARAKQLKWMDLYNDGYYIEIIIERE